MLHITSNGRPALRAIRFEDPDAANGEIRVLGADNTAVAMLVALDLCHCAIPTGDGEEVIASLKNCWRLTLLDANGDTVETSTLFRPADAAPSAGGLSTELAAWAALSAVSDEALTRPARG